VSTLEKRKKLLVAESEVYRELLKLELHNVRIATLVAKKKLTSMSSQNPFVAMGAPMAFSLFRRKRRFDWRQLAGMALEGWQLYQAWRGSAGPRSARLKTEPEATPAAEEYLEKRM
jgi:hypothetical protein